MRTNAALIVICFVYMGMLSWKLLVSMSLLLVFTVTLYLLSVNKVINCSVLP
ncbi:hypothetical protein [Chitinophaga pinensis]|uniref:hypothetical protein n=1 Tax=Chitinophaga pinensis TaxID=79329 RepID=UPI0016492B0A|nr:hypothetical protein [Chitinophaga pinensis]